ncbi:MAG: UTP--glucose-1-phosphate uridylyltransferase [Ruminococcus sp.]
MQYQEAYQRLESYGQTHLLQYYDTLSPEQQAALLQQIADMDFSVLERSMQEETPRGKLEPLGACTISEITEKQTEYRKIGLDAIRSGSVGAVLLAGGQGSRLGCSGPKGVFQIGVNNDLTIFECLFRNLMEVTEEAGVPVPLFIMTSEVNDAETKAFLKEKQFFGYPKESVYFFVQEMAPVVDADGKILLETKSRMAVSPNGNGGWFSSMQRAGLLNVLEQKHITWLNVFAVDNVLQRMADPCFIGATIAANCTSGSKVVAKADPEEKVGVLCLEDGKPSIVEYFEMTNDMRNLRESDGTLTYRYGVILNYLFRVDQLRKTLSCNLPLHRAFKSVACLTEDGTTVKPEKPNGYKLETLVLDMVHMQENCLLYEVEREREFAPVKNATGVDSVETARALLKKNGVTL